MLDKENKKCNLIFHTGYPKTATTYVQENIQKVKGVFYLGCHYKSKNFRNKIPINKWHNQIFPIFRREVIGGSKNFTRNNYELICNYANSISQNILNNSTLTHFVISDEKIGDYFNAMGEYNTFLTFAIGNKVKELLKNKVEVVLHLSNSIRRQDEFLWSFFNHHGYFGDNFNKFLKRKLNTNDSIISGLHYYQCLSTYRTLAGSNWNINFVPYEILALDKDPKKFLKYLFLLDDNQLNFEIDPDNLINSKKTINKKNYQLRSIEKNYFLGDLGFKLFWGSKKNSEIAKFENSNLEFVLYRLLTKIGSALIRLDKLISSIKPKNATLRVPEKKNHLILDKFKSDNELLKKELSQYRLEEYGY